MVIARAAEVAPEIGLSAPAAAPAAAPRNSATDTTARRHITGHRSADSSEGRTSGVSHPSPVHFIDFSKTQFLDTASGRETFMVHVGSGPIKSLAREAIGWFNGSIKEVVLLSDLWLLSEAQMRRIEPYFPLSHGIPRVDDRRIVSGIIFVIRNGLRWRDAPADYGPHKTIYNRFIRWSRLGVFNRIFAELAAKGGRPDRLMIDATHLKAHRTAASLLKKGLFPDVSGAPKVA